MTGKVIVAGPVEDRVLEVQQLRHREKWCSWLSSGQQRLSKAGKESAYILVFLAPTFRHLGDSDRRQRLHSSHGDRYARPSCPNVIVT